MLAITFIISACIVALIAYAVLHAVQQAQEPREVDLKHRQMINCVEFIDQLTSLIFHLETKQLPNLIIESLVKKDHDGVNVCRTKQQF